MSSNSYPHTLTICGAPPMPSDPPAGQFLYHFVDLTPGGVYLGYWEPTGIYPREFQEVLGQPDPDAAIDSELDSEPNTGLCFNCGSSLHILAQCRHPRNSSIITLSRDLFQFLKAHSGRTALPIGRLHQVEAWKQQRMQWIDEFVPGEIRGKLLQEALNCGNDQRPSTPSQDWLANIAIWGYPPGWSSPTNPQDAMRGRILGDAASDSRGPHDDEDDPPFKIFGEEEQPENIDFRLFVPRVGLGWTAYSPSTSPKHETNQPGDNDDSSSSNEDDASESSCNVSTSGTNRPTPSQRWARYPNTHFSSNLLPVYTGVALPVVAESSTSEYQAFNNICDAMWDGVLHANKPWGEPPPPPSTTPPPLPSPLLPPPPTTNETSLSPSEDTEGETDMVLSDPE